MWITSIVIASVYWVEECISYGVNLEKKKNCIVIITSSSSTLSKNNEKKVVVLESVLEKPRYLKCWDILVLQIGFWTTIAQSCLAQQYVKSNRASFMSGILKQTRSICLLKISK